jgi:hypothetical protein
MTTLHLRNLIDRLRSRFGFAFVLLALNLASFALPLTAQAADGGLRNENTAEGDQALNAIATNTANTGSSNTAVGSFALFADSAGSLNTACGARTLQGNTIGGNNTAMGGFALQANGSGNNNTATGAGALTSNTMGGNNTATGVDSLAKSNGDNNTAIGFEALLGNSSGFNNSASGASALLSNTTGFANTADGFTALQNNTTGNSNTAAGDGALAHNTTGSFNIAVGINAGSGLTTGSNNIDIGSRGAAGEARKIRIGTAGTQNGTFVAGIRGITTANANAVPVVIDSAGQLGTVSSSRRFKSGIKPMDQTSEAILGLNPVTFHYKSDNTGRLQFGLIAEEVAKVNPDLVVREENGEIYTVRYEAVNAMLLNEFLKAHRKLDQQQAMIDRQQKQIEALTATVQKVSDQIALGKPAPQLVANP